MTARNLEERLQSHASSFEMLYNNTAEPNGGSRKVTFKRHIQRSVRLTVDTKPVKRS